MFPGAGQPPQSNDFEERKAEMQLMKLNEAVNALRFELEELRNIEDPASAYISTLEEDFVNYTEAIARLEEGRTASKADMEVTNAACKEAEQAFSTVNESIRAYNDDDIKTRWQAPRRHWRKGKIYKKYYLEKQKGLENYIASIKKRIADMQKEVEGDIAKAAWRSAKLLPRQRWTRKMLTARRQRRPLKV